MPDRGILEWIDIAGGFLRTSVWVDPGGSTGALEVALQDASNAELLYVTIAAPTVGATSPTGGQYHLCQDVALLNFATIPGTTIQVVVAGPKETVFGPNSTVVDATDPDVAAIIAGVVGVLADASGNVVTAFVSGSKSSRRVEQV